MPVLVLDVLLGGIDDMSHLLNQPDSTRISIALPSHPHGSPRRTALYCERPADAALLRTLQAGRSAHVRAARQAGKTTLIHRTHSKLTAQGYRCVMLDMGVFSYETSATQWYHSLAREIARGLGLPLVFAERHLSAWGSPRVCERFSRFLREALRCTDAPVVLFLDEADSFLKMPRRTAAGFLAALLASAGDRPPLSQCHRFRFCLAGSRSLAGLFQDRPLVSFYRPREIALDRFDRVPVRAFFAPRIVAAGHETKASQLTKTAGAQFG